MKGILEQIIGTKSPGKRALEILKYLGPGLLVTVGFIDPGNWASNIAAGSSFGYTLLWMVTLSTVMLILLQHNAAHLGIATGLCISEAAATYLPRWFSFPVLGSAVVAAVSTALAEILGAAIAINMLTGFPLIPAIFASALFVLVMLFTNSYRKLERWIIGFVSLIGLAFLVELSFVTIDWPRALAGWVTPAFPSGSLPVIMSVLGAVVMPHNLFLHSEVIQSRRWDLEDEKKIRKQLDYEFLDTLVSMLIGWAINSAMILLAAATFFAHGQQVGEIAQAANLLEPLLGKAAWVIFALALLFSGISSSITAGMAGGSIFAGIFREPYDTGDRHTKAGIVITVGCAACIALFVGNPYRGLILSQTLLSIQLPWTIFLLISLTSSKKVMGKWVNSRKNTVSLLVVGLIVSALNIALLVSALRG